MELLIKSLLVRFYIPLLLDFLIQIFTLIRFLRLLPLLHIHSRLMYLAHVVELMACLAYFQNHQTPENNAFHGGVFLPDPFLQGGKAVHIGQMYGYRSALHPAPMSRSFLGMHPSVFRISCHKTGPLFPVMSRPSLFSFIIHQG